MCLCVFVLQVELYEDFARSGAKRGVDDVVSSISEEQKESKKANTQGASHIFQVSCSHTPFAAHIFHVNCSHMPLASHLSGKLLTCTFSLSLSYHIF